MHFNSKSKLSLNIISLFASMLEKLSIYTIIKYANLKGHCQSDCLKHLLYIVFIYHNYFSNQFIQ